MKQLHAWKGILTIHSVEILSSRVDIDGKKWEYASIINKKQNPQSRVHTNIEGYLHNYVTSR